MKATNAPQARRSATESLRRFSALQPMLDRCQSQLEDCSLAPEVRARAVSVEAAIYEFLAQDAFRAADALNIEEGSR